MLPWRDTPRRNSSRSPQRPGNSNPSSPVSARRGVRAGTQADDIAPQGSPGERESASSPHRPPLRRCSRHRGRNRLMTGPRLALVADDQRLATAIQTRLKQALGQPALQCRTDSFREHLGPQADGLHLLALALPCDPEPVQYLVQELRLQRLPPFVLVVEGDGIAGEPLQALDAHFAQRLRWPDEADALVRLVKERLGSRRDVAVLPEETVIDVIRRRLLSFT